MTARVETEMEKLARACHADAPGTALDRWRALCAGGLIATLLGAGRDVTLIVGKRTERKTGDFDVIMAEQRNCRQERRVSRAELAADCGWEPTSGHVKNVVRSLSSLEIVAYPTPGVVALRDWVR